MRTSISLDDRLAERVKRQAAAEGVSVSSFIARILDDALKRPSEEEPAPPFRLVVVGGDGALPGVDLEHPGTLFMAEDEEAYGSSSGES